MDIGVKHEITVKTILGDGRLCYYDHEDGEWVVSDLRLADAIRFIQVLEGVESVKVTTDGNIFDHKGDSLGHLTQCYTLTWIQPITDSLTELFTKEN